MNRISPSSIDREQLDARLRRAGIARDLEAETDSRYVRIGDELTDIDGSLALKVLPEGELVSPQVLGLVFWTWVNDDEARHTGVFHNGCTESPILDYLSNVTVPFGEALNVTSGSDDAGDYVAIVISYEELIGMLEQTEKELEEVA